MSDSRRDLRLADTLCHLTDLIHAVGKTRDRLLRGQLGNHNAIPQICHDLAVIFRSCQLLLRQLFHGDRQQKRIDRKRPLHRVGRADVQHGHHKIGTL